MFQDKELCLHTLVGLMTGKQCMPTLREKGGLQLEPIFHPWSLPAASITVTQHWTSHVSHNTPGVTSG